MKKIVALFIRSAAVSAVAGVGIAVAASPAGAYSQQWASIAISDRSGTTGDAWNYGSQIAAERAATRSCGRSDCVAYVDVASGWCAAVARAEGWWSWAKAPNRAEAAANAIGASNGRHPVVVQSVCQN